MAVESAEQKRERELRDWKKRVEELIHQVGAWAQDRGWGVSASERHIDESRYGEYIVPELAIRAPSGVVYVEPIGRDVAGADGRVDILAWPSLTRMMLVRHDDQWSLQTDSGVDWPEGWNQQTFARIVDLINAAA